MNELSTNAGLFAESQTSGSVSSPIESGEIAQAAMLPKSARDVRGQRRRVVMRVAPWCSGVDVARCRRGPYHRPPFAQGGTFHPWINAIGLRSDLQSIRT